MTNVAPIKPAAAKPAGYMNLSAVRKGKLKMPLRVLVFGAEGCGKTTFCAGAPKPILIGVDSGSTEIDIPRFPEPRNWQDILDGVASLENDSHEYESLVLDPAGWAESLLFQHITGGNGTIEDYGGGYGRGYTAALDQWRLLLSALERVWRKGMNVLISAHSQVKTFTNPEGAAFDRYELAMNAKAAGLLKQWVDFVLFARFEAYAKIDAATKKAKGHSTGARVINSAWSAAYDAKARVTLAGGGPNGDELPMSWVEFSKAVEFGRNQVADIKVRIAALASQLGDEAVFQKIRTYVADAGDDVNRLNEIANAVVAKLEETKSATASK